MNWKDLKIATKLYVGFGITMTLALIVGIVAYNGISSVSGTADEANYCANISEGMLQAQVSAEQFSQKPKENLLPTIDKAVAGAEEGLQQWTTKTTTPTTPTMQSIDESIGSWKSNWSEYVTLRKEMGYTEKDGLTG